MQERLFDIQEFHPGIQTKENSQQNKHVQVVVVIPLRYSVTSMVGKLKANTSRETRNTFKLIVTAETSDLLEVDGVDTGFSGCEPQYDFKPVGDRFLGAIHDRTGG